MRAAGDGRAVAAGFADHRRDFAGDRRFVDRGDALDHSPSLGMMSPASTSTRSPGLSAIAGTVRQLCAGRRQREQLGRWLRSCVRRSVAACALPRPSATASAKLANSTVNQSQRLIWNGKAEIGRRRSTTIAHEEDGGERRDDLDHEHHRIADQRARIELHERVADRRLRMICGSSIDGGVPLAIVSMSEWMWSMIASSTSVERCRRASRNARRSGRAPGPGRRSARRR